MLYYTMEDFVSERAELLLQCIERNRLARVLQKKVPDSLRQTALFFLPHDIPPHIRLSHSRHVHRESMRIPFHCSFHYKKEPATRQSQAFVAVSFKITRSS